MPRRTTVASLRGNSPGDGDGVIPPLELYKNAVEEYRFQVTFNWSRTQYLLVFNAAVLAAAAALTARPDRSAALVYALGVVAAALSSIAQGTQHGYYQAARDRLRRLEVRFEVPLEARVDTTGRPGGRRVRAKVTLVVHLLLWAMVVAQAAGIALVLSR